MHYSGRKRFKDLEIGLACLSLLLCFLSKGAFAASGPSYFLHVPIATYFTDDELNQCDNHVWASEPWGGTTVLDWANRHSRECMHAAFTANGDSHSYIRTDYYFQPENWNTVTQIKLDVFVENGKANMGLQLELHDTGSNAISIAPDQTSIPPNVWTTLTYTVPAPAFLVSKIFIVANTLVTGDGFCLSNFRIHRAAGDEMWDTLANPGWAWVSGGDFVPWINGYRNEPVSHTLTYNNSPGALCIPWTKNAGNATLRSGDMRGHNLSGYTKFRARVYSLEAGTMISMGFWNDPAPSYPTGQWAQTGWAAVVTANTWQLMEWDVPTSPFDWLNPASFQFLVNTSAGTSGTVYIDAIEFVK
jgi:hypothetical protein